MTPYSGKNANETTHVPPVSRCGAAATAPGWQIGQSTPLGVGCVTAKPVRVQPSGQHNESIDAMAIKMTARTSATVRIQVRV